MKVYKYQVLDELKKLKEIDKSYFFDYFNKLTVKHNHIVRIEENKKFKYYCTNCKQWHEDNKIKIKSLKKCPYCKHKYKVISKVNNIHLISNYITVLETNERNELIIRLFYAYKRYDKQKMIFCYDCFEIERINADRQVYVKMNTYSNMGYWNHTKLNREPTEDKPNHYYGCIGEQYYYTNVITKNIKRLVNKTAWKYSCLDIVARKHIDLLDYVNTYKSHNDLELFIKNKNYRLVNDVIRHSYPPILEDNKIIKYLKYDLNITELENAVQYDLHDLEDIKAYAFVNYKNRFLEIIQLNDNEKKVCRYLYNKKKKIDYYRDYLSHAQRLGMNLQDTRVLYPKNLVKAHNEVIAQYEVQKDIVITKRIEQYSKELQKYNFKEKRLSIFPAGSQNDLIKESLELDHCVRTYAERMSSRKTSIFFIRKTNQIDKPYVTLELKNNIVIQCRGYRNNITKPLDNDIKTFVNDWCRKFNFKSCFN